MNYQKEIVGDYIIDAPCTRMWYGVCGTRAAVMERLQRVSDVITLHSSDIIIISISSSSSRDSVEQQTV